MQRLSALRRISPRLFRTFSTSPPQSQAQSPITWRLVAISGALGTAGLAYYSLEKQRRIEEITSPRAIGKAAIGGPFKLLDGAGRTVTEANLHGRWSLIYFGFTMCPDICPAELSKVAEALTLLEKKHGRTVAPSGQIVPVFISVDPERDSPQRADEYARGFHEGFLGLSGDVEEVKRAAKAYRVYYSRGEGEEHYLVDHSIITYLMDPGGGFAEFYGKNCSAAEMAARIEEKMMKWKE